MKLFEVKNIFEAREDYIAQSMGDKILAAVQKDMGRAFNDPLAIVKKLSQANPKYIQWITKMYVAGQFKLEDIPRLRNDLTEFDRVKKKLEKKDINQYNTLASLYKATEPFKDNELISNRQQDQAERQSYFENGEAKLIHRDKNVTVVSPQTEEAACYFGKGTKWCTSGDKNNLFSKYHSAGNLFVIFTKEGAYQLHYAEQDSEIDEDAYENDDYDDRNVDDLDDYIMVKRGEYSFMDAQDQPADFKAVAKKYPVLFKIFKEFAIKHGLAKLIDINTVSEEEKATMLAKH